MTDNVVALLVAVGLIAVLAHFALSGAQGIGGLPVVPRPLMTAAERRTITYIEEALPGTRVHAQVSMGALMKPRRGLDRSTYTRTFNRFCSKRVDFVVEDRATGRIVMLVELDDKTHDRRSDFDRDRLTTRAGYLTVRLPASERPTRWSVRRHIETALQAHQSTIGRTAAKTARKEKPHVLQLR
jgi:very-short-patch-repair endonuclease